jgi:hypothetical protein
MLGLFYQYLIRNDKIVLPGLGTVILQRLSSESDIAGHTVSPPLYTFAWRQGSTTPPKRFFVWLSHQLNIAEEEAAMQVNNFVADVKREINAGKEIKWDGVGIIRRGFDSGIEFEPERRKLFFEETVQADKVIHENSRHTILVGDAEKSSDQMNEILLFPERKKLRLTPYTTAVALLILALLFTAWYIFQNGLNTASVSGKSRLTPKEEPATYKQVQ